MQKLVLTFLMLFFLLVGQGRAQTVPAVADSIDQQFAEMLRTSSTYKDNKVVKRYKIADLRKNTRHQILQLEKEIKGLNTKLSRKDNDFKTLQKDLDQTKVELDKAKTQKEQLSLFGLKVMKSTYQIIVLVVVVILVLLLLIFVFSYMSAKMITREAQQHREDLEREYDEYRKKALETQQKLGRQLQDERNKNADESSDDH